jgi:hypothetical protein
MAEPAPVATHDIREVLAHADHPIATLNLSGTKITIGFDESDSDPAVYVGLPELSEQKVFMSPCEAHLFIAAVGAALCQAAGKVGE